jgi:Mrp family chromosome partitioning ATPase
MKNWEKMFTSLRKGSQVHKGTDAYRAALKARHASGADTAEKPDAAGSGRKLSTTEDMRQHLDDVWSNILLESGGKNDVLMFCGSTSGVGCSFMSFQLALFLAVARSMKTLYIDTAIDLPEHVPCIPGMAGRAGLTSFLNGGAQLDSLVAATDYDNLFVLPSGARKEEHSDHKKIISGSAIEELVEFGRSRFDIAIFDGQPLISRPLTIEFAKRIKNVIMVCRYGSSRREVSMVSIDKLRKNGIPLMGVVLNDRQFPVPPAFYSIMK